jgi:flagellar protein FlaG
MASVSVSHMILFIASMLVAASVAGVFTSTVDELSQAIDDQGLQVSDTVRGDIEIISDNGTGACVYNCDGHDNLTLLVKNTGSSELVAGPESIEVLVDGRYQPPSDVTVEVLGEATTWERDAVVRLNVTRPGLSSDDHRAKVIVSGDEEVFEFRVP